MKTKQWSELTEPGEIAGALVDLYREKGEHRYDEDVTQIEHALQCASRALAAEADHPVVVAALLHDIGHLLIAEQVADRRDRHHEEVAARFLRRWFGSAVLESIRLHVAAKRYLCSIEPGYVVALSNASIQSLELQGGPMSREEGEAFERLEHSDIAVDLRRWDDQAKDPSASTPGLEVFGTIVEDLLWSY